MYLKRLEIQGFKSFADKTVIKFDDGITAVVGPNGSGKSNISDSIRWVLGEQSIKSLRGSKMEDVIFSGASDRKALGFAEVTMVLDNSSNIFPIEYEELAVTRRMFRSGESEYYINKSNCRLKDIRELFMDTGIGKDGYSIIGQGRIDDILSSKSEDRRRIFEEAAGIVKYKSRKEESERKLQKTKDNLTRIDDIISELENQIGPLEKQSIKAKRYMELSELYKKLDLELFKIEYENIKREEDVYEKKLSEYSSDIDKLNREREELELEISDKEQMLKSIEEELEEKKDDKYSMANKKEKLENDIRLLNEKASGYEKNIQRIQAEILESVSEMELNEREKEKKIKFKDEFSDDLKKQTEDIDSREEKADRLADKINTVELQIEKDKEDALEHLNNIAEYKLNLNTFESHRENLTSRLEQIEKYSQNNSSKIIEVESKSREFKKDIEKLQLNIDEKNKKAENLSDVHKDKQEQTNLIYKEIEKLKSSVQDNQSSLKFLREMKQEYEGYYKGVKNFLTEAKNIERLNSGIDGLVAELATVDKKFEKAIEVSLGGSIQNIVVKSQSHAKSCIEFLKSRKLGRITFLPRDSVKGKNLNKSEEAVLKEKGVIGLASDIVDYDAKYEDIFKSLLGRVVVVENIDDMIHISKHYGAFLKLVTLEGDVLNPGGSMTGGSFRGNSLSLLGRERQIKEIEDSLTVKKKTYLEKKSVLESLEEELKSIEIDIKDLKDLETKLRLEKNRVESEYSHILSQEKELGQSSSEFEKETLQIETELKKIEEKKEGMLLKIEETSKTVNQIQAQVSVKTESIGSDKKEMEAQNKAILELKITKASLEESFKNIEVDLKRIAQTIEKDRQKIENLKTQKETELREKTVSEKRIKETIESIELLDEKIVENENQIISIIKDMKKLREKKEEQESSRKIKVRKLETLEKQRLDEELKREKSELKLELLSERIWDEYQVTYAMIAGMETSRLETEKIQSEADRLKAEIRKIGNVNIESIEEYEKVRERYEFLGKQREDLTEAEKSLKHVIREMNQKMKEQFKDKFEEIRVEFEEIFVKLFGGGKADIKLEEPEDILATGIEIIAQPPGKKLQSLSLLSGGERALTAIAILFAILKTRPTPFCILDEIEAALDESNVYRYADYLKAFSKDTQFIVITHRKGTMESADSLYGVTMEENGISKILSVKLTDKLIEKSSRG